MFGGRQMDDDKTLGFYEVKPESTIQVVVRMRPGGSIRRRTCFPRCSSLP
jgi:hypothetical protein